MGWVQEATEEACCPSLVLNPSFFLFKLIQIVDKIHILHQLIQDWKPKMDSEENKAENQLNFQAAKLMGWELIEQQDQIDSNSKTEYYLVRKGHNGRIRPIFHYNQNHSLRIWIPDRDLGQAQEFVKKICRDTASQGLWVQFVQEKVREPIKARKIKGQCILPDDLDGFMIASATPKQWVEAALEVHEYNQAMKQTMTDFQVVEFQPSLDMDDHNLAH